MFYESIQGRLKGVLGTFRTFAPRTSEASCQGYGLRRVEVLGQHIGHALAERRKSRDGLGGFRLKALQIWAAAFLALFFRFIIK